MSAASKNSLPKLGRNVEQALSVGYDAMMQSHLAKRIVFEKADFVAMADRWDVFSVEQGGKVLGMVFFDGPYIHMAVLPEIQGQWSDALSEALLYGLANYGHIIGQIGINDTRTQRLAEKWGFTLDDVDDTHQYWRLTCL